MYCGHSRQQYRHLNVASGDILLEIMLQEVSARNLYKDYTERARDLVILRTSHHYTLHFFEQLKHFDFFYFLKTPCLT